MTDVVFFCGPTISASEVLNRLPGCDVRGPVARGDVTEVARRRPAAIAIVDGYFRQVPAVWHKEILWALSIGVPVFGASSMGALRAAELHAFGMVGVGKVFESYHRGEIDGDDEVAVAHASQEHNFRLASDALVDIRSTLKAACNLSVLRPEAELSLVALARHLPYEERTYSRLLNDAQGLIPVGELSALRDWLPCGRVRQKHLDALELLDRLSQLDTTGGHKPKARFTFEPTDAWIQLQTSVDMRARKTSSVGDDPVLEEVLLSGRGRQIHAEALGRALALDAGHKPSASLVQAAAVSSRLERTLESEAAFRAWIQENQLSEMDVDRYFRDEATIRRTQLVHRHSVRRCIADQLRAAGEYARHSQRAQQKSAALTQAGLDDATLEQLQLQEVDLWEWFFHIHLGFSTTRSPHAFSQLHGSTLDELRNAVIREYCYAVLLLAKPV